MRIAIVDNDSLLLQDSIKLIEKNRPLDEVYAFEDGLDLLEFIVKKPCEVVFMDPYLMDMDGIMLAREIKEIIPNVNLIFLTEYDEYYREAMELRASGYILKPLREKDIIEEMKYLRYPPKEREDALIQVSCFGDFSVKTIEGTEIHFERKKSKELFAYLVHKKGAECSLREAAAVLFEDVIFDDKLHNYTQKIISSMMKSLRAHGVEAVIEKAFNSMKVNPLLISCDYYFFIELGAELGFELEQSYLENYQWAEYV
jgi:two-component SAPR family response regulator